MLRFIISAMLVLSSTISFARQSIEWDGIYQIKLADFQSPSTQIGEVNMYSLYAASGFEFSFHMSSAEFAFTKNFNSKVNCVFRPSLASLVAPDTLSALGLVALARYDFDLNELYARKFRKQLYENKGAFSSPSFFQPLYDQIQKEFLERSVAANQETQFGQDKEKLKELHDAVLKEVEELSDFCKACKPIKKKNR